MQAQVSFSNVFWGQYLEEHTCLYVHQGYAQCTAVEKCHQNYKRAGGLGSYTHQKVVEIEGDYSYQFFSRPFDKVEEDGNWNFLYVTIAV